MKVTAEQKEIYVSTLWGAAIIVHPGQVKEVGDDLGYASLAAGCIEVRDEPAPKPKPKAKPKEAKKKTE